MATTSRDLARTASEPPVTEMITIAITQREIIRWYLTRRRNQFTFGGAAISLTADERRWTQIFLVVGAARLLTICVHRRSSADKKRICIASAYLAAGSSACFTRWRCTAIV